MSLCSSCPGAGRPSYDYNLGLQNAYTENEVYKMPIHWAHKRWGAGTEPLLKMGQLEACCTEKQDSFSQTSTRDR